MSRNMIRCVQYVFEQLAQGSLVATLSRARLSPPSGDPEEMDRQKRRFTALKFSEPEFLLHNIRIVEICDEDGRYIAAINLILSDDSLIDLQSTGIYYYKPDPAMLLALLYEGKVKMARGISPLDVQEQVLSQQDDPEYKGHDLEELVQFFEPVVVLKIDKNSVLFDRPIREIEYYVSTYDSSLINPRMQQFIDQYRAQLLKHEALSKENVFLSVTSTHYKHAFLELYRCIENIYSLPRALLLKKAMGITLTGFEIAKLCRDELGWHRREEDSIKRIFRLIPSSEFDASNAKQLRFAVNNNWDFSRPDDVEDLASRIYKIRNQMVHQFDLSDEVEIDDGDWGILIGVIFVVIDHAYSEHSAELPRWSPQ